MPFPVRDTAFVELVRDAYASCDVSNRVLGVLFSLQAGELADMRRRYRWPRRVNVLLEMTAAEKFAARQAADEARAIALYGSAEAVADVLVLRRRGFVVYRWGTKVMVGGVLVSLKRMRKMATRERRLSEAARPVEIMAKDHIGQVSPQLLATQGNSARALVASRASGIHP